MALLRGPSLLVAPASFLGNWIAEIERFAPTLRTRLEHPSVPEEQPENADLVITTYGMLLRKPELASKTRDVAVLDEAQAIKNLGARQTRAVKELKARVRIALTGTPVENRPLDLEALVDRRAGLFPEAEGDRLHLLVPRLRLALQAHRRRSLRKSARGSTRNRSCSSRCAASPSMT